MTRKYRLLVEDILDAIVWIGKFTKDMHFEQFRADEKTKTASVKKLGILGEAAKNIPQSIRVGQKNYHRQIWRKCETSPESFRSKHLEVDTNEGKSVIL